MPARKPIDTISAKAAPSAEGLLEALRQDPGWDSWGERDWVAAALCMAAGAAVEGSTEAAERLLSSLRPADETSLLLATAIAARAGLVAQLERFGAMGGPVDDALWENAHERARPELEEARKNPYAPRLPEVFAPLSEALHGGRAGAALWLLERGCAQSSDAAGRALTLLCSPLAPGESPADRDKAAKLAWKRMGKAARAKWTDGVAVALLEARGERQSALNARHAIDLHRNEQAIKAGGQDETARLDRLHAERSARLESAAIEQLRQAANLGARIEPGPDAERTPLGMALEETHSTRLALALLDLGADLSAARTLMSDELRGFSHAAAFGDIPTLCALIERGHAPATDKKWAEAVKAAQEGEDRSKYRHSGTQERPADRARFLRAQREARALMAAAGPAASPAGGAPGADDPSRLTRDPLRL
jgi:hypothetical protein